jgi:hypothetical protein
MVKFLGFETMSREDHLRLGLFGVVLLSLECVLAGVVSGAELRLWAVHAVAAALGIWAMVDVAPLPVRSAASVAIVAVANEAVLLLQTSQSLKYLVPALLLLGVSVWVLERSITANPSEQLTGSEVGTFGVSSEFGASSAWDTSTSALNLPPPSPSTTFARNLWAPILALVGVLMSLLGFLVTDWVVGKAFFGLLRENFTYADVRTLWTSFGAPGVFIEAFVGFAYVFGYVGMIVALIGATSQFFRSFKIDQPWRLAGVIQLFVVIGLLLAEANITVLSGAWVAPIGLGLATLGFWTSTVR